MQHSTKLFAAAIAWTMTLTAPTAAESITGSSQLYLNQAFQCDGVTWTAATIEHAGNWVTKDTDSTIAKCDYVSGSSSGGLKYIQLVGPPNANGHIIHVPANMVGTAINACGDEAFTQQQGTSVSVECHPV